MTRRTIPEIRDEIRARLEEIRQLAGGRAAPRLLALADEIEALAEETRRRPPVRRAPPAAIRVTDRLARRVRAYAAAHPRMTLRTIGRRFLIDQGRVSEILSGKRGRA